MCSSQHSCRCCPGEHCQHVRQPRAVSYPCVWRVCWATSKQGGDWHSMHV